MEVERTLNNNDDQLIISDQAKTYLKETAKWANFLSIVGFVIVGLMILFGLFFGAIIGAFMSGMQDESIPAMSGGLMGLIYVIIAIIYLMPTLYLYRFGRRTKEALKADDTDALTRAFKQLKSCFKFLGIMMIVVLAIYAVMIVFAMIVGSTL